MNYGFPNRAKASIFSYIQFVGWTDDSIFALQQGDRALLDTPGLGGAKGMAAAEFGEGKLVLSKEGNNHYPANGEPVFFSSVVPRNELLDKSKARSSRDKATPLVEKATPLTELKKDIFVTAFIDRDEDGMVDNDEYQYVVLDL